MTDKIYVPIVNLGIEEGEHPAPLWWNKDKKSEHSDVVGTIEYICKDAILEWVKETEKSRMRVPIEAYNNEDYQAGFIDGFAKFRRILINKLNSL